MSQKGFAPIVILIVLLIVVVIAVGAYYLSAHKISSQTKPAVQPTLSPSVKTEWKGYTDTADSLSFLYPSFAQVNSYNPSPADPTGHISISHDSQSPDIKARMVDSWGISIWTIDNSKKLSLRDLALDQGIAKQVLIQQGTETPFMDTMLNGLPAVTWDSRGGDFSQTYYLVKRTNGVTAISFDNANSNSVKIINKILSSIKFTDQTPDTASWKTYSNQVHHYSFKYPAEWNVSESNGETVNIKANIDGDEEQIATVNTVSEKNQNIINCETHKSFEPCDFIPVKNGQVVINWTTNPGPGSLAVGPSIADAIKNDNTIIEFYFNFGSDPTDAIMRQLLNSFQFTN